MLVPWHKSAWGCLSHIKMYDVWQTAWGTCWGCGGCTRFSISTPQVVLAYHVVYSHCDGFASQGEHGLDIYLLYIFTTWKQSLLWFALYPPHTLIIWGCQLLVLALVLLMNVWMRQQDGLFVCVPKPKTQFPNKWVINGKNKGAKQASKGLNTLIWKTKKTIGYTQMLSVCSC